MDKCMLNIYISVYVDDLFDDVGVKMNSAIANIILIIGSLALLNGEC